MYMAVVNIPILRVVATVNCLTCFTTGHRLTWAATVLRQLPTRNGGGVGHTDWSDADLLAGSGRDPVNCCDQR